MLYHNPTDTVVRIELLHDTGATVFVWEIGKEQDVDLDESVVKMLAPQLVRGALPKTEEKSNGAKRRK